MKQNLEADQQIHIKLSGLNRRSLVDLAQKVDTSVRSEEYTEQISDFQKSNIADLSRGDHFDKSNVLSQETSYFMNNIDVKKKGFIQSELDFSSKKPDNLTSLKYDLGYSNEMQEPFRQKAETLANSQSIQYRQSQIFNPRGNMQITMKKPLAFQQQIKTANFGSAQHTFHYIATAAWVSEMLIQMNTATYHDGDFITDRKGKSSPNTAVNILLHLPLLLKLKGMSIILSKLEFLILQHLHKPYIMQICKQLLQLLLLIHLMACSYITLAKYEQNILDMPDTWLDQSIIQKNHHNWWSAYIEAQLWAFYTMGNSYSSSVVSQYEYAFTSFWMLVSCVLFAYNINALGNILQDINSISENYKKDLNVLNRYMKRKKIDIELQRVMNSHLVKQYEQESSAQFEAERDALSKLSVHMRNKLVTESNKHILSQFSFFNIFSHQTLLNVYQIMEEESYSEGQIIQTFELNTLDSFLYLILQGGVEIIQSIQEEGEPKCQLATIVNFDEKKKKLEESSEQEKIVLKLKEGQQFGEFEFFSNSSLPYVVKSQKQAVVIKISRNKFLDIISENKYDYQKFMEMKQRIQFNNQFNVINSGCYICKNQNHHFIDCDQTHFPKHSEYIITRYNYSPGQMRLPFERINKKHYKYVIKIVSQHMLSEIEDIEEEQSPNVNEKDEETSIYKQNILPSLNQNGSKVKVSQEIISEVSDQQSSVLDTQQTNQKVNIDETVGMIRSALGNQQANMANRRSSFRASFISKKQHNKTIENFQDMIMNFEKRDTIDDRISSQQQDEKPSRRNSSLNNLSELSPNSVIPVPILQSMKSTNLVSSLRAIRRSIQYNGQVILPYENVSPEIDFMNSIQDLHQKPSEPSLNLGKRNSIQVPIKQISQQQSSQVKTVDSQNQNPNYTILIENTNLRKQWNGSSIYWAFDKRQDFLYYFPHHNCKNVLRNHFTRLKTLKEKKKLIPLKNEISSF